MVKINEIMPLTGNSQTSKMKQSEKTSELLFNNEISDEVPMGLGIEKSTTKNQAKNPELANAPSPKIKINGEEKIATIVVSLSENKLYKYNGNGEAEEVHSIASGAKNTPTNTGIRKVSHIETYPYASATGTKRKANPKAYGPKILILTTIDPKTGKDLGSNGEFIHGNSNASSIGKYASHGCMRMHNEEVKKLAQEVKPGSYVLIQK